MASVLSDAAAHRLLRRRTLERLIRDVVGRRDRFLAQLQATGNGLPRTPAERFTWARLGTLRQALEAAVECVGLEEAAARERALANAARPALRWASYAGRCAARHDREVERLTERLEELRTEARVYTATFQRLGREVHRGS